ncbi:alpha/beta-hydrolase [Macroventuria anomochaeta]|uniref:Alpha/beta-hydrolase n=1 Tax=Macroventuria anomochaeta TaxID=301207 RepID=A0ACB6SIU8_9PLEO|nr:alpha/beta-hydrolase [Macroventuria anomochaeta]KAF2633067.1 alpha/beta-hydrolase [Macroventuria anomochaeta]
MADQPPNEPPNGAPSKFVHQDVSKLGIASAVLKAIVAATGRAFVSPFKGPNGANTYFKDVALAAFRTQLGNLNLAQDRYVTSTTCTPVYHQYCISHKITPDSITLPSGTQAHWLGSKDAQKVLIYFHGGGYVLPCTSGHLLWLDDLCQNLGQEVSVLILAYDLAPESAYPTQLRQAVELLRYLTETEGRNPADIIVGGDSAGGNLTLGLLSHLAHPHPEIAELKLNGRIHAAMLISPWCSLTQNHTPAHVRNAERDMFDSRTLSRWAAAFLNSTSPFAGDPYSEPVLATPEWWEPVADVVEEVLIWGGENEILIDGIEAFAKKFSQGFRRRGGHVDVIVTKGALHIEMIIERGLGYKGDSGTGSKQVVEEWVKAML